MEGQAATISPEAGAQAAAPLRAADPKEVRTALAAKEGFHLSYTRVSEWLGRALVISVDPQQLSLQLERVVTLNARSHVLTEYFLGAGDWTPWLRKVTARIMYREVTQLLARDLAFRETEIYARQLQSLREGRIPHRNGVDFDTVAKLDQHFEGICALIESIRSNGILRRRTLGLDELYARHAGNLVRPPSVEAVEAEVGVAIGADGSLYRLGPGNHRTAIARLLKLPQMPVEVRLVHVDWLKRRMAATGLGPWRALRAGLGTLSLAQERA